MFTSDGTAQQDLADVLKLSGTAALAGWQVNLVNRLHQAAYNQILAALVARGYTPAQVQSWDAGADFERSITLHLVLSGGGAADAGAVSDRFVANLDWRPLLSDGPGGRQAILLTSGGAVVLPAGPVGQPNFGQADTSGDVFQWPPRDGSTPSPASQLGRPAVW